MNTQQGLKISEPTAAVLYTGNTWALNFILFALLIDIIYRSAFFHESPWDLFALIVVSGAINTMYLARYKAMGQVFSWKLTAVLAVVAFVAAFVSAILAMIKAR